MCGRPYKSDVPFLLNSSQHLENELYLSTSNPNSVFRMGITVSPQISQLSQGLFRKQISLGGGLFEGDRLI